ncbi:sigma factor SigB regulation protein RsbQ [Antarctobacter heliothermus]|uniref:Sigma factor SigB regulation protein RsbQ n=1 Tax=Antarctobacter heliothermus TaxID=74033 RepID=A0A222DXV3_9RHOB|nr:sigma factor SigB regulation protein RsbQ [Antarctobacter heliothermus]
MNAIPRLPPRSTRGRSIPVRPQRAEADPVVFLPGLFMTSDVWVPICQTMGLRNRLLLDLPGHSTGETAAQVIEMLHGDRWLDRMETRIAEFSGGRPVHLVGHSTGGLVSLLLAWRAPQLVRSLVLVGAPITGHRDLPRDLGASLMAHDYAGRWSMPLLWRLGLATRNNFERTMATVMPRAAARNVPDEMRQSLQRCTPEAVRQFGKWVLEQDVTATMERIDKPCLAIIGRNDSVVPAQHQIKLLHHLPQAQAQLVPGGHLPFVEKPQHFARTLRGWLSLPHDTQTAG